MQPGERRVTCSPLASVSTLIVSEVSEHPSIIDEDLWSSVQRRLEANGVERRERQASAPPNLLTGVLFDADSQAMTPIYAIKKGVRYRYYVSHHLVTGTRGEEGNGQTSGQRIPAANLEALAVRRLRSFFADSVAVIESLPRHRRDAPSQKRANDAATEIVRALDSARWASSMRSRPASFRIRTSAT